MREGKLFLLGRLEIREVGPRIYTDNYPGETGADSQEYQAEAFEPMRIRGDNEVPLAITERIQCKTQHGTKNLFFVQPGLLDKQTLRVTRELTEESAKLLDQAFADYEETHPSESLFHKSFRSR